MRFNKGLVLPVFIYTEQEYEAVKMGLLDDEKNDVGFEETEPRVFYAVDSIYPYKDFHNAIKDNRTVLRVAGETSVIRMHITELRKKIAEVS